MQMPVPDDWDGLETCRWAVCWPYSPKWNAILHGLLEMPSQGRFWDASTGNIVDTQTAFNQFYERNFNLREVIMACDDAGLFEVAAALREIAVSNIAIANAQCCGNTSVGPNGGVTGSVEQGDNVLPLIGDYPDGGLGEGEYPPNYDNEDDYLADKCRLANMVADGWIGTMRGLATLTFTNVNILGGLLVLALVGIITLPAAAIPIAIGYMLILVGAFRYFDDLADGLEDRREQIVCDLYLGNSVSGLTAILADVLDIVISGMSVSGPVGAALKALALLLVNTEVLNRLFSGYAALG